MADLERRILDFVPQDYFKVALVAATESGAKVTLWHAPKEHLFDRVVAETIRIAASVWSGQLGVEQKDARRPPPKLFSKDALARRCAKRFGWDPQRTAKLAQDLYDQGYLSYPRTESEYLPESQSGDAWAIIDGIVTVLTDLVSVVAAAGDPIIRKGQKGHYIKGPGEHHAIVPLRKVPTPGTVGADQFRLWDLVARSFLAAHLPDGVDARTRVTAEVDTPVGPKLFSVSGSVVKVPGWRAVYGTEAENEPDDVPGRTKVQQEATAVRLPPINDGEAARATRARVETATTEPPRRITRGELPVVMGRLIDQVEDPTLKAALANPANPNEPKGLGTAATRDSILPKLLKSEYVSLLKGKDPPIKVTDVGLVFIAVVRGVFPAYADPVGRAQFEAQLGEIGRATTPAEAQARVAVFKEQTRTRVVELIAAVGRANVVEVAPAPIAKRSGGTKQRPTKAMVKFASSIAARKDIKLPRGLKSKSAICRAFLDEHAAAPGAGPAASERRQPTEAMLRYARELAQDPVVDCPPAVFTDFSACKAFLARYDAGDRAPEPHRSAPARRDVRRSGPP
ncbi:MAG TPA: DNA topoisomerase [Geminicoccaceae bacterium]|nr:DNA topoisomerase [Geminicoccus sp.]HMU50116.1 DNA topoisomerase [Geminicoccaceae bacterium]